MEAGTDQDDIVNMAWVMFLWFEKKVLLLLGRTGRYVPGVSSSTGFKDYNEATVCRGYSLNCKNILVQMLLTETTMHASHKPGYWHDGSSYAFH